MLAAWLAERLEAGEAAALIRVIDVQGSAPREAGALMAVTASDFHGTIGGGALEPVPFHTTPSPQPPYTIAISEEEGG